MEICEGRASGELYGQEIRVDLTAKRNEVLIYATMWMNFGNTMLSERSRPQKTTRRRIPFMRNVHNRQVH